jgi:hypothetical protein
VTSCLSGLMFVQNVTAATTPDSISRRMLNDTLQHRRDEEHMGGCHLGVCVNAFELTLGAERCSSFKIGGSAGSSRFTAAIPKFSGAHRMCRTDISKRRSLTMLSTNYFHITGPQGRGSKADANPQTSSPMYSADSKTLHIMSPHKPLPDFHSTHRSPCCEDLTLSQ